MATRADELKSLVDDAWAATETLRECEAGVRQAAFERLLNHLLANDQHAAENGDVVAPLTGSSDLHSADSAEPLDTSHATEEQRAEAVGRYFDIAPEEARDLFDLTELTPKLQVASKKLPEGRADAVRKIALLVCGVRTALGIETGSKDIRQAAEDYKKYDRNFMPVLTEMPELVVRGKSRSRNRMVRLRVIGIEEARSLAASLAD